MNDSIKEAVEDLFSTCLEVSMSGIAQVHIEYRAHINELAVDVYPEGSHWAFGNEPTCLLSWKAFIAPFYAADKQFDAGEALKKVHAITDQLNAYLLQEAA
ncbi:hypothetical protein [Azotobacter beijerinckii]|uniref:Phage protein n=1 Tax=Azotobacter beijerinckii TaxID=170623 RepID=A0A1I0Z435_9GAMM|nr:hypothetical protein [Azotobacter beijerinckii]SFB19876.1 hypothetical protein SAMN04244571_01758 [Azotobacter beijerinckii]